MLSEEQFNDDDIYSIQSVLRGLKLALLVYSIFFIPLAFLFGLLGFAKKGHGYWPTTIGLLAMFTTCLVLAFLKQHILYRKDLKHRIKLSGIITVIEKSPKNNDNTIYTDAKQMKKLNLYDKEMYNKIEVGDQLTIEISKYSKKLLRLKKAENDLM
jgi:hypothetical protein